MTGGEIICNLEALGHHCAIGQGDTIDIDRGTVAPPDLIDALKAHKAEALEYLAARARQEGTLEAFSNYFSGRQGPLDRRALLQRLYSRG